MQTNNVTTLDENNNYTYGNEKGLSEEYFNDVNSYVSSFFDFADKLDIDEKLKEEVNYLNGVSYELSSGKTLGDTDPNTFKGKLRLIMVTDIIRNFEHAGHPLNLREKEQFGVLLYMIRVFGSVEINYAYLSLYYTDDMINSMEGLARQMMTAPEPEEIFIVSRMLWDYDVDLLKKYHVMLYRIISLTAKYDNNVTKQEEEWMKKIMAKAEEANKGKDAENAIVEAEGKRPMEVLDGLIGLTSVKHEVNALANLIKVQRVREEKGLKVVKPSYHCVFTGNPGTGKTTVARILAGIYHELGILKKGQLVETDRSGLVAEYVGQTAVKTNKIIDKAIDGVLFIDEAYTLVGESEDYGAEAIATLLKRMEDDRERLVVILAGYTKEMDDFINSNPGLQSRFSRHIEFPDYTSEELMQIFNSSLAKYEYTLTDEAKAKLANLFDRAIASKDDKFGNGRFVRNIFDKTVERQSVRLAAQSNLTVRQLSELTVDDIPD